MAQRLKNINHSYDGDIVYQLNKLSRIVNDEKSSITDIKKSIVEMRSLVNYSGLIFQTSQEIFNNAFNNLSKNIRGLNTNESEEFSNKWIDFMHQKYKIDNPEQKYENATDIKLTDTLSIPQPNYIAYKNELFNLSIGDISLSTTLNDIQKLSFDYSPNIIKHHTKKLRHIGPLASLDTDFARLLNHPLLFKIEHNKIKSHIIYNLLLHLLFSKFE